MKIIQAVEIYELYKSRWNGDEYDSGKESFVGTYTKKYKAKKEKQRLEKKKKAATETRTGGIILDFILSQN